MFCCHGDDAHVTKEEITLFSAIDFGRVQCFNEAAPGSGVRVFKAACSARDKGAHCESAGGDAELLFTVPFTSSVRLKALCVSAGEGGAGGAGCPLRVKVFANASVDISDAADAAATQELLLTSPDAGAELWHSLKVARFGTVHQLQLYFSGRLGAPAGAGASDEGPPIRIYYIGIRAEVGAPRVGVVHATYESRAQLADHKSEAPAGAGAAFLH